MILAITTGTITARVGSDLGTGSVEYVHNAGRRLAELHDGAAVDSPFLEAIPSGELVGVEDTGDMPAIVARFGPFLPEA